MNKSPKYFVLLLLILGTAAFLRFYRLDAAPPGLFHDEAMNGVDALDVIYNGYHPLYFERNQGGREPLFIYLTTASVWIFGASTFAMRLVPAFIGLLTVAAAYAFAKELFGQRVALVASALLALSHWHVHFSRTSFRAISFPLLEILAFYLLWKGITSGRKRWYALGGLAAGLAMYTYFSSRLLPLLLAVFFVYLAIFYRRKVSWGGIGFFCVAGALVFAPLGYYYLTHQDMFFARLNQVSAVSLTPQSTSVGGLWDNTVNTLGMFSYRGDVNWKYNLPGKPIFDQVSFALLLIGLALSVFRAKRQPAYALVIAWLIVMLLPGALSTESPSFLRALGIVPVVFILPALAVDSVWSRLENVLSGRRRSLQRVMSLGVIIWLAFVGTSTFRDYFVEWSGSKEAYYEFSMDMVEVGRYLNTLPADEPVFLSSKYYHHPSVLYFLRRPIDIRWFNGSQSLVFPDYAGEVTYVFPYSAMPENLDDVFPESSLVATAAGPGDTTAFVAYRARPASLRQALVAAVPQKLGNSSLGEVIDLVGFRAGKEVKPGAVLPFDLLWQVRQKPEENADYAFFSHLVDHKGQMWGLGDANEYLSPEWKPGDLVLGKYDLAIRPETPPGRYVIDIGIYDRWTGDRLFLSGKEKLDHLLLSLVKVQQAQQPPAPTMRFPEPIAFSKGVRLLGFDFRNEAGQTVSGDGEARPGEKLKLTLYWQTSSRLDEDYTVFLHLLSEKPGVAAQDDSQPAGNLFPTTFWEVGEVVADEHSLSLDPALPPGSYLLEAGMYLLKTGERLAVLKDGQAVADHVILTKVQIQTR